MSPAPIGFLQITGGHVVRFIPVGSTQRVTVLVSTTAESATSWVYLRGWRAKVDDRPTLIEPTIVRRGAWTEFTAQRDRLFELVATQTKEIK